MFVFISHSGTDTWIARRIVEGCESAAVETFLDEAQIAIGAVFETDILTALKKSDELVVLFTPWALERPYVWLEIGVAWFRVFLSSRFFLELRPSKFRSTHEHQ